MNAIISTPPRSHHVERSHGGITKAAGAGGIELGTGGTARGT